jgi:hypothetical protein
MSEPLDPHRVKAMELAVQAGGSNTELLERAKTIHSFLTGAGAGKTAATPEAAVATGKTAAAPRATPTAGTKATPAAAAPKGAASAAPKGAASTAPKAAASAASTGAAPKGDTKDPKGNNTYDDVTAALQKVMRSVPGDSDKHDKGRKLAYEILAAKGGGVKGVRDLKPALYDAVVAGCEEAIKGATVKPTAAPKVAVVAAPTVVEDDLGQAVDTSGASAETVNEDDPPEGGSGEGEDL